MIYVLLAATLLLTACSGATTTKPISTSGEPPGERLTISFAVPDWELERGYLDHSIKQFETQNPDVHVELKPFSEILGLSSMETFDVTDDLWQKLVSGADAFRVIFLNGIDRHPVREGLVYDLKPFIDANTTFHPDDFYADALDASTWEGGVWAIPTALDYELILFDKKIFDATGVSYPETGWTWDNFVTKARALTIHREGQATQWGFVRHPFRPVEIIELRTGSLLDDAITPPIPRFTEPEVVEAVKWLFDLTYRDPVMATEPTGQDETAAMWSSMASTWPVYSQQDDVGVIPYPIDEPDADTTPMHFEQVAMSAGTSHPEAVWRWIDFLSRQPPSQPGWAPARRSVTAAMGFWDGMDAELASALRFGMDHAAQPSLGKWDVAYAALDAELRAAFEGEKSVEDALRDAQSQAIADLEDQASQLAAATPAPVAVATKRPEAAEGTIPIAFMPMGSANELRSFRDAAERFHAVNPGIKVEVKNPSLNAVNPASLVDQADCFQSIANLDSPGTLTVLYNLNPLIDADPSFDLTDFFPSLLSLYQQEGQLWGMPAGVQPYVIAYNQALLDAAGQTPPGSTWSIDDFLSLAQTLTRGEGTNRQYGLASTSELLDMLVFVERLGGQILDETTDPPSADFTNPDTIEAVKYYTDLSLLHDVKPICVTEDECETLIQADRVAMWGTPLVLHDESQANVLPFPEGPGGSGLPILHVRGYFISAQTASPQACWEWIKFLTTDVGVVQGLPSRRSMVNAEVYRQRIDVDVLDAYRTSVENNREPTDLQVLISQEQLTPYVTWLEQAYRQIVEGGDSPQQALSMAQRKADDYHTCVVAAGPIEDPSVYRMCAEQADPGLSAD